MALVQHDNNTKPLVEPDGAGGHRQAVIVSVGAAMTLAASAARTTSASGTAVAGLGKYRRVVVLLDITASTHEAGDTLDVYVDVLGPDGTTWLNAIHFAQQAGNGAAVKYFAVLEWANAGTAPIDVTADAAAGAVRPYLFGSQMRARWALADSGDGDTSHTFAVTAYGQE